MCCRLDVGPLDPSLAAAILRTGSFEPSSAVPSLWRRYIEEEGASVLARFETDHLSLSISPSITNMGHHHGKRVTAGVYFEIAAKYAEKIGGTVTQRATVMGCRPKHGECLLLVARYPDLPMSFERICHGFQEVLLTHIHEPVDSSDLARLFHEHPGGTSP